MAELANDRNEDGEAAYHRNIAFGLHLALNISETQIETMHDWRVDYDKPVTDTHPQIRSYKCVKCGATRQGSSCFYTERSPVQGEATSSTDVTNG